MTLCVYNDFRPPFWDRFFDIFPKWRKCEISEEYNAKRDSEPSKSIDCWCRLSIVFLFFSEPPSTGHFLGPRCQPSRKSAVSGRFENRKSAIFDFQGVSKSTLGAPFSAKKAAKTRDPEFHRATWSRPGRDSHRKLSKQSFSSIVVQFFIEFG